MSPCTTTQVPELERHDLRTLTCAFQQGIYFNKTSQYDGAPGINQCGERHPRPAASPRSSSLNFLRVRYPLWTKLDLRGSGRSSVGNILVPQANARRVGSSLTRFCLKVALACWRTPAPSKELSGFTDYIYSVNMSMVFARPSSSTLRRRCRPTTTSTPSSSATGEPRWF